MSLKAHTEFNGRVAIVELKGALVGDEDTDKFREVVADFIEQGNRSLIVNMQRVNYMNSSGIGALIAANASYRRNGGQVKLALINNNVQNVLAVTKLVDVFDICDSMDAAIDECIKLKS